MNIEQWKELLAKYGNSSKATSTNSASGLSAQDSLRPQETRWFDKTTGQPMGAGYADDLYSVSSPDISRQEWNQHLGKAWGESPITTQNMGGKTIATRTMDASNVQGYSKWGYGTGGGVNGKPLTQTYILPEGALDFKFAQSNAPLSDAKRSGSYRFGGNYSNATVEKSPTRFTSADLKLSGRSGGITDFTTGEQFLPSRTEYDGLSFNTYPSQYNRFGGSGGSEIDSWNDEWAQSQGFKDYQDYLNRK
ncbi:MAG: hypothetical protein WC356_02000 [Candidatus Micrarchaeia archaeon]|jgi:hypothetical protein